MRSNVRAKRATTAGSVSPVWRYAVHFRQPGPGGLPLALRWSEGLGISAQLKRGGALGQGECPASAVSGYDAFKVDGGV